MTKNLLLVALLAIATLGFTGCATQRHQGANCDGSCCKEAAACKKCCGDNCAACCKK